MGKIDLGIDLFKVGAKIFKAGGKKALKDSDFLKALKCRLPESLLPILNSRNGLYKIAPEEKVIDTLMEVKTKSGKAKFTEEALRAEIKEVNFGPFRNFDITGAYSDKRCREIAQFAERNDVNLRDVAEFSLLPENTFGFVKSLSKDRFKIFKEFMRFKPDIFLL